MLPSEMVKEFQRLAGGHVAASPTLDVPAETRELRLRLIDEEVEELRHALGADDLLGVADAVADLLYVVYGAALVFGIPIDEVFAEVHRSNLAKFREGEPQVDAQGKVLKPAAWTPPDIQGVLERARPGSA